LILFASSGGVRRVGAISSAIIPFFVLVYISMGSWVLLNNLQVIPEVISTVFSSAFTGTAAIGGFAGSALMATISQGARRGCYTGDLGVGYASVIHSESSMKIPEEQASLAVFDIFLDSFIICTTSLMLVLVTQVWHEPIAAGMMVQTALSDYFPHMNIFMPIFLFLLGYNTINAYFCVGIKCSEFLSPKYGKPVYYVYAILALVIFSFAGVAQAQTVMTIAGGLLLVINCLGIFRLRREISFAVFEDVSQVVPTEAVQQKS
jgi:AGCS family alanine or glycine:cation symporter